MPPQLPVLMMSMLLMSREVVGLYSETQPSAVSATGSRSAARFSISSIASVVAQQPVTAGNTQGQSKTAAPEARTPRADAATGGLVDQDPAEQVHSENSKKRKAAGPATLEPQAPPLRPPLPRLARPPQHAWVRGCVGAWVRGCVGAWVPGLVVSSLQ